MMLYPPGDAFLTVMQERGAASATVTASDDLCIVVGSICERLSALDIMPRIFLDRDGTLRIEVRS